MTDSSKNWKRRIFLLLASQCISLFGSQLVQMAIVWYVTLETASGMWVAAFSLCSYLPQFFISFPGGVWADRYSRKTLIICADALIAGATLLMLLLMPHITSEPALLTALLIMSALRSAGAGVQTPAVNAALPQLVPADRLMRCNGLNAAMQSLVQFAAPAAAAVVLSAYSLRTTLTIDILTAAIGIGLFACIRLPRQKKSAPPSVRADMLIGTRYALSNRAVRGILSIYGWFVFLTVPAGYLSGLLVSRIYGDTYWHLTAVELAGFGGMMAGGLLMSLWGGFKKQRITLTVGLALFGLMAVGMGVIRHFIPYLIFMALYGVALTCVQTTITSMLQRKAEPSMHGRVFGLMSSLYSGCYPFGMALFGPLADRLPLEWMMLLSGVALMVVSGLTFCNRLMEE